MAEGGGGGSHSRTGELGGVASSSGVCEDAVDTAVAAEGNMGVGGVGVMAERGGGVDVVEGPAPPG